MALIFAAIVAKARLALRSIRLEKVLQSKEAYALTGSSIIASHSPHAGDFAFGLVDRQLCPSM